MKNSNQTKINKIIEIIVNFDNFQKRKNWIWWMQVLELLHRFTFTFEANKPLIFLNILSYSIWKKNSMIAHDDFFNVFKLMGRQDSQR